MKHASSLVFGGLVALLALAQPACNDQRFSRPTNGSRFVVEIIDAESVSGTRLEPLPLKIDEPQPFRVVVRALDPNGNVDPGFNGFVRMSAKPGAIDRIESEDADGRSLRLTNGLSPEVEIRVSNAYGATYILADDLGYAPVDALSTPPPACANGLDDDGDGKVDFPVDEGCAFANDNTEGGGSYSQGASTPIFYALPRIADVRGIKCDAALVCSGTGKTPYPKEQLFLDTGLHDRGDGTQAFDFDVVVTRISSDGFYLSDINDPRGQFNGVFVFNFSSPARMRVCDRLKTFAGTAGEFFGFTQIAYPTWTLEEWDPQVRPCLVPEAIVLGPLDVPSDVDGDGKLDTPPTLIGRTGSLVRALTSAAEGVTVSVTSKFGPGLAQQKGNVFTFTPDASNCDLDKDGNIDFSNGAPEGICATQCAIDPDCTEFSNFAGRSVFRLKIANENSAGAIQVDATASPSFKPLEFKGQTIKAFTGIMSFFSGGSQFTIEARCKDDIVVDVNASALPSDKACVFPRTDLAEDPQ